MPTPYLQGTGTVPEATALLLRGIQTDAYGEVLGGHKAIFDPVQSGLTTTIPNGGTLSNLVVGGASAGPAVGTLSAGTAIAAAKGIDFSSSVGAYEYLKLPSCYDLNTLGSEPSVVISKWITPKNTGASLNFITGFAYQVGSECQWAVAQDNTANRLRVGTYGLWVYVPVTVNVPVLITIFVQRTGAGTFAFKVYKNAEFVGSVSSTYPFRSPVSGSPAPVPSIGWGSSWAANWLGVTHRSQLIKVDPAFDIAAWLAAEIAANASRWA